MVTFFNSFFPFDLLLPYLQVYWSFSYLDLVYCSTPLLNFSAQLFYCSAIWFRLILLKYFLSFLLKSSFCSCTALLNSVSNFTTVHLNSLLENSLISVLLRLVSGDLSCSFVWNIVLCLFILFYFSLFITTKLSKTVTDPCLEDMSSFGSIPIQSECTLWLWWEIYI